MALQYAGVGRELCNNAIFITGNGRSGTTILGKLIHSMRRVEYVFEPPTLNALLPVIDDLPEGTFRLLFEAYCIEELLIGQVTGRAFNFNKNDDSYIGLVKPRGEIDARLHRSWWKDGAMASARSSVLALKLPDMVPYLPSLRRQYPGMRMVVTQRAPNPVIQSIIAKQWFTDRNLAETTLVWPSQTPGFCTPAWVAPEAVEGWRRWSALERAGYYYVRMSQSAAEVDGTFAVSYERLVEQPEETVARLAGQLGLEPGDLTPALIASTKARSAPVEDWMSRLSSDLRRDIEALPH